jgi:hypothetical protein
MRRLSACAFVVSLATLWLKTALERPTKNIAIKKNRKDDFVDSMIRLSN